MFGSLSQIGFDRMRQEYAGAERRNKSSYQFKHWKSPLPPPVLGPDKSLVFQDGFVASRKWFPCTVFPALTTPPLACNGDTKDEPSHWLGATAQSR